MHVRLVGGSDPSGGRIEILHNDVWGTICDDAWDRNDGAVICRMLGYSGATSVHGRARHGEGSGKIWLDDVNCDGGEKDIEDCRNVNWGQSNCGHNEDASVICH